MKPTLTSPCPLPDPQSVLGDSPLVRCPGCRHLVANLDALGDRLAGLRLLTRCVRYTLPAAVLAVSAPALADDATVGSEPVVEEPRVIVGGISDHIDIRERLYFKTDSAEIPEPVVPILDDIAAIMRDHPDAVAKLEIHGHIDKTEGGYSLSKRRAEAVRDALIERGVSTERLVVKDFGPDTPLAPSRTEEERAQNRRVSFKVLSEEECEKAEGGL